MEPGGFEFVEGRQDRDHLINADPSQARKRVGAGVSLPPTIC